MNFIDRNNFGISKTCQGNKKTWWLKTSPRFLKTLLDEAYCQMQATYMYIYTHDTRIHLNTYIFI